MSVAQGGRVVFEELASFEENWSGRGGALCNRGSAEFLRRSFFNGNAASGAFCFVWHVRTRTRTVVHLCVFWGVDFSCAAEVMLAMYVDYWFGAVSSFLEVFALSLCICSCQCSNDYCTSTNK